MRVACESLFHALWTLRKSVLKNNSVGLKASQFLSPIMLVSASLVFCDLGCLSSVCCLPCLIFRCCIAASSQSLCHASWELRSLLLLVMLLLWFVMVMMMVDDDDARWQQVTKIMLLVDFTVSHFLSYLSNSSLPLYDPSCSIVASDEC